MPYIPVDEIPTVSLLYYLKKLDPASPEEASTPNKSFNDRVCVIKADITKLEVDAIVNAANNSLLGGGGVDGAIHRAAGRELLRATRKLGGCETGFAKITDAFDLPCEKVIHAVGPVYYSDSRSECARDLASCYTTSLKLSVENGCKSIAFSALSTGVYGYPSSAAAKIAIKAVKAFLESEDGDKLEKIIFVTFMQKDIDAYNDWLPIYFPSTEPESKEPDAVQEEPVEASTVQSTSSETNTASDFALPSAPLNSLNTEPPNSLDTEDEWEEIEAGGSADNGPQSKGFEVDVPASQMDVDTGDEGVKVDLPDVPTTQPDEEGHIVKKLKSSVM